MFLTVSHAIKLGALGNASQMQAFALRTHIAKVKRLRAETICIRWQYEQLSLLVIVPLPFVRIMFQVFVHLSFALCGIYILDAQKFFEYMSL